MTGPRRWGPLVVGDEQRRRRVRAADLIGLDGIEVLGPGQGGDGRVLRLRFLRDLPPERMGVRNVVLVPPAGGVAVRAAGVGRRPDDADAGPHVTVRLDRPGGPGTYRLRLVDVDRPGHPMAGVDPCFAELTFSFDDQHPVPGPPAAERAPAPAPGFPTTYLTRDYAGLRQLLLDRLAVTLPADTGRNAADLTVTLVELFAYLADDLSYAQDDAATEAYLSTARHRVSVRRHSRLVGYRLGEGCAARAWVCVGVPTALDVDPAVLAFASTDAGTGTVFTPLAAAPGAGHVRPLRLRPQHTVINLWTFGEQNARLAAGACSAPLRDERGEAALQLQAGDVLVLEAITDASGLGPPDERLRHPVRLTAVHRRHDVLYDQPFVEVRWDPEDALPFDLPVCVTAPDGRVVTAARARGNAVLASHGVAVTEPVDASHPVLTVGDVTWSSPFPPDDVVARIQARRLRDLLSDVRTELTAWRDRAAAGHRLDDEQWRQLDHLLIRRWRQQTDLRRDASAREQATALDNVLVHLDRWFADRARRARRLADRCDTGAPLSTELLYEVATAWGDAAAARLDPGSPATAGPAADAVSPEPADAVAQVLLTPVPSDDETGTSLASWTAAPDLLDGTAGNRFVVETDDRGTATLRLDPRFPQPDSGRFTAHYWAGNGAHGNLPAGSIDTVVLTEAAPEGLRDPRVGVDNPLPAVGGADPEPLASAKLRAPGASRESQPRGLRAADYATIATRLPGVGRAAAAERFDGRRILIDVAITSAGHGEPSPHLVREVEAHLQRVRRIGHDLRVGPARYRGVRIAVTVAVDAAADEQDVRRRVTHLLGGRVTASRAPFSRTRLGFGTPVHASAVVAAVLDVPGVVDAALTEFTFADAPPGSPPRDRLVPEPLQILRLDDDPVHPERGLVSVTVRRAS